ncbi:hypothetical protein ACH3VR_03980 [Microbacterium sp. B2969]|uniref:Uncharacterized protein n=1 Tax=Microbacterium alkaliflavum TaxID=3248839 RepID=A0ABW7Q7E4_9MICO
MVRRKKERRPDDGSQTTPWNPGWQLGFLIFLVIANVAALVAIPWLISMLRVSNALAPEITVSIIVIAGASLLVVGLATAAVIFRHIHLANRSEAMGLPAGSMRALIALMLILIFTFVSVFLISHTDTVTSNLDCLTLDEANAIPIEQIQSRVVTKADCGSEGPYFIVAMKESKPSAELSQQLMTTLGTLVVAIASFYFGSQAVTKGRKKNKRQPTGVPTTDGKPDASTEGTGQAEPDGKAGPATQVESESTTDAKPSPPTDQEPAGATDAKPAPTSETRPAPMTDVEGALATDTNPTSPTDVEPILATDAQPAPATDVMRRLAEPEPSGTALVEPDDQAPSSVGRGAQVVAAAVNGAVTGAYTGAAAGAIIGALAKASATTAREPASPNERAEAGADKALDPSLTEDTVGESSVEEAASQTEDEATGDTEPTDAEPQPV